MKTNELKSALKKELRDDDYIESNLINIVSQDGPLGIFNSIYFPVGGSIEVKNLLKTINKLKKVLKRLKPSIDWSGSDIFSARTLIINKGKNIYIEFWYED